MGTAGSRKNGIGYNYILRPWFILIFIFRSLNCSSSKNKCCMGGRGSSSSSKTFSMKYAQLVLSSCELLKVLYLKQLIRSLLSSIPKPQLPHVFMLHIFLYFEIVRSQ